MGNEWAMLGRRCQPVHCSAEGEAPCALDRVRVVVASPFCVGQVCQKHRLLPHF